MRKTVFLIILVGFFISCSNKSIVVIPAKDSFTQVENFGLPYFLPRLVIEVDIEVTTEYFFPGPYNRYAEKFLSIIDAPSQSERTSYITDINIKEFFEPDPNAAFVIIDKLDNSFFLSDNSILLSVNTKPPKTKKKQYYLKNLIPDVIRREVHFPDMTIDQNFTSILDTTYKIIEVDSIFQKIPVYNPVMTRKTMEQKAEEAAEFILDLRKARFFLLHGDLDMVPEEGTMSQMLINLDKVEEQYLELFIGKTVSITNTYTYTYTPRTSQHDESLIMFYLCDEFGIMTEEHKSRIPIHLKYESKNTVAEHTAFYNNQREIPEYDKGLYYRIPGQAIIYIVLADEIYAKKQMTVPQAGIINNIPKKLMEKDKFKLVLDPFYGSILRLN